MQKRKKLHRQFPVHPEDWRQRILSWVDRETERKIKAAASAHKLSVSGYVAAVLRTHLRDLP